MSDDEIALDVLRQKYADLGRLALEAAADLEDHLRTEYLHASGPDTHLMARRCFDRDMLVVKQIRDLVQGAQNE